MVFPDAWVERAGDGEVDVDCGEKRREDKGGRKGGSMFSMWY